MSVSLVQLVKVRRYIRLQSTRPISVPSLTAFASVDMFSRLTRSWYAKNLFALRMDCTTLCMLSHLPMAGLCHSSPTLFLAQSFDTSMHD